MLTEVHGYARVCVGVLRGARMFIGMCGWVGVRRCVRVWAGVCRFSQMSDVRGFTSVLCVGVLRCARMFIGMCGCAQVTHNSNRDKGF